LRDFLTGLSLLNSWSDLVLTDLLDINNSLNNGW
jgi:hypothetical protein